MTVVERIRAFNRDWTEVLGLLDQGLLDTNFSLAEARVLFELAQEPTWERLELRRRLGMDASYLTRVLAALHERGLLTQAVSVTDRRALDVSLTPAGRAAFSELDERSRAQIESLLEPLTGDQVATLTEAMSIMSRLTRQNDRAPSIKIRDLGAGDLGWVVQRHGAIYADEFDWNQDFEALVAKIVAEFHLEHGTGERGWIAEVDGARAGCVFCRRIDSGTAQLRILLVEPWARGLGLGSRLVDDCIDFARRSGYRRVRLWTNANLVAARRIYQAAGFELVDEAHHNSFGHDLVGQDWELDLQSRPS